MRKSIKITSAVLVLMLLLAQVVCVSAAINYNPSISVSMQQTDHYIKTVTAKVTGDTVSYIWVRAYDKKDGQIVDEESTAVDKGTQVTVSMEVRPTQVSWINVIVAYTDKDGKAQKSENNWYSVGGNSYYNPGSSSSSRPSGSGSWDGIVSGGSSSSSSSSSSSNETNVWPSWDGSASSSSGNHWTGYYEENEISKTYYVTCRSLNVRSGDGTNYAIVGSLHRGDAVEVYDIEDGWAIIRYNGRLRYVSANYISRWY